MKKKEEEDEFEETVDVDNDAPSSVFNILPSTNLSQNSETSVFNEDSMDGSDEGIYFP